MWEEEEKLSIFKMNLGFFISSFLILYVTGGRKFAIPYGVALTNNWAVISSLTFVLDSLQIFFFYYIYSRGDAGIKMLSKVRHKAKKKIKEFGVLIWARNFGKLGVFVLSMLPSFGGGIWSAVLLAFLLKIDKKISYLLIMTGSLIGIFSLALLSHSVIQTIINLIH